MRQPDGSFIADARASLEDVAAVVGADFDVGEEAKEVDTLGGYLVAQVGRVPLRGEVIPGPAAYDIEVLDADPRRVKRLNIFAARTAQRIRAMPSGARSRPQSPTCLVSTPPASDLPINRDRR